MINIIKISIVMLMTALLVFLSACEKQSETKKQAIMPVVVSGTISHPPGKTEKKPVPKPEVISPIKTNNSPIPPKTISKSKTEAGEMVQIQSGAVTEKLLKKEQEVAGSIGNSDTTEEVARYDSKGKLNPFLPLLQKKEETGVTTPIDDGKPKRILTPLEKMDLSQLKLVAVILMKNKQLAMVEETTGKGYEVRIGTYMGKNSGQVSKINQSSIVVKEYVKDYKGKRKAHFQEIKLHKKEGGE